MPRCHPQLLRCVQRLLPKRWAGLSRLLGFSGTSCLWCLISPLPLSRLFHQGGVAGSPPFIPKHWVGESEGPSRRGDAQRGALEAWPDSPASRVSNIPKRAFKQKPE